ncbi:hypothetical protein CLOM_g20316 [Closterium sp. NIES-68]|nr:hypothetical protein CLOM_g20316 [Closterium sp. NIES-68]
MVILSSSRTLHPNAGTPTVRAGCEWPLTRPPMLYSGHAGREKGARSTKNPACRRRPRTHRTAVIYPASRATPTTSRLTACVRDASSCSG